MSPALLAALRSAQFVADCTKDLRAALAATEPERRILADVVRLYATLPQPLAVERYAVERYAVERYAVERYAGSFTAPLHR